MNNEIPVTNASVDILSETDITYERATTWQRFFNFLIDNLLMQYGVSYLMGILLGLILLAFFPGTEFSDSTSNLLLIGLAWYLAYIFYYTICERYFNGHTLGKLITGTKAIREDGEPLTFKDALLRSLSRLVPFEFLSGFGTPWHDSWTNTTVIKKR